MEIINKLTSDLKLESKIFIMKLTLVIKKGKSGYLIGQLKELPAVFTQGLTVEEVKVNIVDSLELYLEDIREQYLPEGEMLLEEELSFA